MEGISTVSVEANLKLLALESITVALRSVEIGLRKTSMAFIEGSLKPFVWFWTVEVRSEFGSLESLSHARTSTVHDAAF